jgi:hypothetical protein
MPHWHISTISGAVILIRQIIEGSILSVSPEKHMKAASSVASAVA